MGADASFGDGWSSISFPALPSLAFFANLILGPLLVLGPGMMASSNTSGDRLLIGTLLVFVVLALYMVHSHRVVLFRENSGFALTLQKWWFFPSFITQSTTFDVDEIALRRYYDPSDAEEGYALLVNDTEVVSLSTKTVKRVIALVPELKNQIIYKDKPYNPKNLW